MRTTFQVATLTVAFITMACNAEQVWQDGSLITGVCETCTLSSANSKVTLTHQLDKKRLRICDQSGKDCQLLDVPSWDADLVNAVMTGWEDIDGDGYTDLYLYTSQGAVNAYAHYWLNSSTSNTFISQGELPLLTVCSDSTDSNICSYENNGQGGKLYRKTWYTMINNKLTKVRVEEQIANPDKYETLIKHIYRRSGKELVLFSSTETSR